MSNRGKLLCRSSAKTNLSISGQPLCDLHVCHLGSLRSLSLLASIHLLKNTASVLQRKARQAETIQDI